jgi:uncharacterized phosphosugar-binding protein
MHHFQFTLDISAPVPDVHKDRPRKKPYDKDLEDVRYALKASAIRSGDVLLVSSVSGKSRRIVELAIQARELGIKVIGFTSLTYASNVESDHPSGKKLSDVVDVTIDCGAPYGDGAVDIPGFDFKLLPVSGVSMITAGWMIWGTVIDKMTKAGNPPTVFMSQNREGGMEYYKNAIEQYNKRGY